MSAIIEGICVCVLYCAVWFAQECTTWDFAGEKSGSIKQETTRITELQETARDKE